MDQDEKMVEANGRGGRDGITRSRDQPGAMLLNARMP